MQKIILIIGFLIFPFLARASYIDQRDRGSVLVSSDLTSERCTSWVNVKAADRIRFKATYTYGAGTSLDMTKCESSDSASSSAAFVVPVWSDGVASTDPIYSYAVSASAKVEFDVNVPARNFVRCCFSAGGSPTSSDLLQVDAITYAKKTR